MLRHHGQIPGSGLGTEASALATTQIHQNSIRLLKPETARKLDITVLSGGPGGEREVSLQSGACVSAALETLGHKVHREDINPQSLAGLARQVDCVFIALHGTFGEDGQVQTILERRGLAYTGSGPDACALAMNKAMAKEKLAAAGLPTARWAVATCETVREAMACWTLPVVVKPIKEGSSLGIHIVREAAQFRPAIHDLLDRYGSCIVEEFIPGREITVSVLGDQALDPIEIRTRREFYDYQAKYVDNDTEYDFNIDLPTELLQHVRRMSLEAHRVIGCRDVSRVDWRIDPVTGKAYILEVNVIPGMTSHSLLPKAAERAGLDMAALCQTLINAALKR